MPKRIKVVVCELQLLKRDQLSHPVCSCCRRVWMDVESSRHGRLCFSCHHPMEKSKSIFQFFDMKRHQQHLQKTCSLQLLVWCGELGSVPSEFLLVLHSFPAPLTSCHSAFKRKTVFRCCANSIAYSSRLQKGFMQNICTLMIRA